MQVRYVFGIAAAVIFDLCDVLGLLFNLIVFFLLLWSSITSKLTMLLMRLQTILDFCVCLLGILLFHTPALKKYSIATTDFFCHVWYSQFLFWFFVMLSTSNLVFLVIDRLWAIVYAASYKHRFKTYAGLSLSLNLLYALIMTLPLIGQVDHIDLVAGENHSYCAFKTLIEDLLQPKVPMSPATYVLNFYLLRMRAIVWFIAFYLMPSFINLGVYASILVYMKKNKMTVNILSLFKRKPRQETDQTSDYVPALTLTIFGYAITLIAANSYASFMLLLRSLGVIEIRTKTDQQYLSIFLTTLNSCINPVLTSIGVTSVRHQIGTGVKNVRQMIASHSMIDRFRGKRTKVDGNTTY